MKRFYSNFTVVFLLLTACNISAQVGISTPAPEGALDVVSTTNGVVIPRIQLTSKIVAAPVVNPNGGGIPVDGTLIYNPAAAGVAPNNVAEGFYYWDNSMWNAFTGVGSKEWSITGNGSTVAGTNFLGTTDAQDLRFKTQGNDKFNIGNTSNQFTSYNLGTATAPTFSWNPDTNTGVFSPLADNVGIATNGTEKMRINSTGQVGISTPTPEGALDVFSGTNGIVIPRITLTSKIVAAPVVNPNGGGIPIDGTLIYNIGPAGVAPNNVVEGFYYWDNSMWNAFTGVGSKEWSITGNASTVAGPNFLGTTDAQDLRFKTQGNDKFNIGNTSGQFSSFGLGTAAAPTYTWNADLDTGIFSPAANILGFSTNAAERMRIIANGRVVINSTTTVNTDRFAVYNTAAADYAVNGYSTGAGVGVFGGNTGAGLGVYGLNTAATGIGVYGANSSSGIATAGIGTTGAGVYGSTAANVSAGVFGRADVFGGSGVYGTSNGISAVGTEGYSSGSLGIGVWGTAVGATGTGVYGTTTIADGIGAWGNNDNTSGTGIVGSGNNQNASVLGAGSGGAFTGTGAGSVSYALTAATGTGVIGIGNNLAAWTLNEGSGGAFTGAQWGVFAKSSLSGTPATDRAAFVGNFNEDATPATVYVGARLGGINYKVLGTGSASVSTTMPTRNGERILFAPEAPENWFFDIGEATLVNGRATVALDPLFVDCIADSKPFKVFVQGAEDTYGTIRVTRNQHDKTFVLEDMGGNSNGIVQYSIYAIWKQKEGIRFPEYHQPIQVVENRSAIFEKKAMPTEKKTTTSPIVLKKMTQTETK